MASITFSEAADIIDTFGPDRSLWPNASRDAISDLIAKDPDFAEYVSTAKKVDDMLSDWKEDIDGAGVQTDEDDDADGDDANLDDNGGDQSVTPADNADDTFKEMDLSDLEEVQDIDGMLANIIQVAINQESSEFNVFTRDYDKIVDLAPPPSTPIDQIQKEVAKAVGPLMKDLRRLVAARSQVKRTPGMRRGRLHAPNLHRILAGDDRVFFRRDEAQSLDTAISLVVDCSGSMNGSRIKIAAQTAYALGSVLNRLGVTFECLGFTSASSSAYPAEMRDPSYMKEVAESNNIRPIHRYTPIIMPGFKTFEERWNQTIERRFAYIHNCQGAQLSPTIEFGMTPEGCGVEFAARRLLQRRESRKIMIVMTDGEAAGHSYCGNGSQYRIHAAEMVKAVAASGIDIIGVGIQHHGVTKHYPNNIVINSVSEMPTMLLGLMKRLLTAK